MDVEQLVAGYIKLRDRKTEMEGRHKEELAPIRKLMSDIEARLLLEFQRSGVESVRTKAGTAYKNKKTSASIADREVFKAFCEQEDAWEFADIRASKSAISAYLEETGELPPGINWREELSVNFRK